MNATTAFRKPRLIVAALAATATLAVGVELVLSQAASPRLDDPADAFRQDGQRGPVGRPGFDGQGRPGPDGLGRPRPDGFGPGPDGAGPRGARGPGRGFGGPQGPDGPGRPMPHRDAVQLSGTVSNYNFGPRGNVEALMIKTSDKTIQVNLPPPLAPFATQAAAVGASVNLSAYPEMGLPDHPVYEMASLKNEQGRELKQPSPDDRKFVHQEGTVKTLNYGRLGEVNGAVLDSGDFVHLGPAAASVKLTVGQKITVDGVGHPMLMSEHRAVEAVAIDGKMLEPAGRPGARGGLQDGGPQGPRGRRGGRGRGGPGGMGSPGVPGGPDGEPQGPRGPGGMNGPGGPGGPGGRPGSQGGRGLGPENGPGGAPPPPRGGRGGENLRQPPQFRDDSGNQVPPDERISPIEP